VHDHRIADLDVRHPSANLIDPAGVLVAERVRQRHARLLGPLPLLDVQVRAAQPRRSDPDDNVERPDRARLVHLVNGERLAIGA
jgi:hypothetical protein